MLQKERYTITIALHRRKVYNLPMQHRTRYAKKTIPRERIDKMRRKFMKDAGPQMQLLMDLMESMPNVSLVVKNADGRIMYTNKYNLDVVGWESPDDVLGYIPAFIGTSVLMFANPTTHKFLVILTQTKSSFSLTTTFRTPSFTNASPRPPIMTTLSQGDIM